jgi:hypothetical protein
VPKRYPEEFRRKVSIWWPRIAPWPRLGTAGHFHRATRKYCIPGVTAAPEWRVEELPGEHLS